MSEMTPEKAAALRAPFDPNLIGQLPKGGTMLDFVGHAAVTDRLLQVDPLWTWEPMGKDDEGCPVIRIGAKEAELWINLTICGHTRPAVGTAAIGATELAKQLISDALRNGAMRFGVGLDLWSKEDLRAVTPPPIAAASSKQRNEIAARISQLTEAESESLKTWWKQARIAKADNLNVDEAEAVLAKLDEIAPEAF